MGETVLNTSENGENRESPGEFLDWMGDKLPRYRAFAEELRQLDGEYHPCATGRGIVCHTERDSLNRLQYRHDEACYRNREAILDLARRGELELRTPADVARMHAMLFRNQENAGHFKVGMSHQHRVNETGEEVVIGTFADPTRREIDLNRSFEAFNSAMEREPALAPVFIACLFMKLLGIHPFTDGNGRTGRLMIQILLYQYGFRHGLDIPFEECFNRFNPIYHKKYPIATQYRYETAFEPTVSFLLKLIRTAYTYYLPEGEESVAAGAGCIREQGKESE